MKCPGFQRLIDHLDGRLAVAESEAVTSHLAGCRSCAEDRDWYQQTKAIAASDDSIEPPQWVLKRAFRVFDAQVRPRLSERIGQMVAWLVFDSLERPALAGVRSTETISRQLLYRADDYSIDLQIAAAGESRANLAGQVLKEGEAAFESVAGLSVKLMREGEAVDSTLTDSLGEFAIRGVERGSYELVIELGERNLTIEGLPVERA